MFSAFGVHDDFARLYVADFWLVRASEVVEYLLLARKLTEGFGHFFDPGGLLVISTPYYGSYIQNLICLPLDKWYKQVSVFWGGGHIKIWVV